MFEAVLVALADHGFTPTAIAARLTYLSAPDSVQGALAAGLLGGGSRFLGVTEDAGGSWPTPWPGRAHRCPTRRRGLGRPGAGRGQPGPRGSAVRPRLGIPCTRSPTRAPGAIRDRGRGRLRGPHLRLFEAIGRVHPQVLGRTLPLNGAGTCGAALADLGLPPSCCAGSRCWPGPPGCSASWPRSSAARSAWTSTSRSSTTPTTCRPAPGSSQDRSTSTHGRFPATYNDGGEPVSNSQPPGVTTTSSSIRAAADPSGVGQYVSIANTMPSSNSTGCSNQW